VGNPPYQSSNEGQTKTKAIWHLFVNKSLDILMDGGYLNMVHPNGWRNIEGKYKETQKLLLSKQMLYLEIHDGEDGKKTFSASTPYDFYCLKNTQSKETTKIKSIDGKIEHIKLTNMDFVPNGMFQEIKNLIAKDLEEKVEVIHSYSAYETRKSYMSKNKTTTNKYPCVANIDAYGQVGNTYYSSINTNGFFGVPKLIFGRFGVASFIDNEGQYGLTQDARAIIETDFINLKNGMMTSEFKRLNKMCDFGGICHPDLRFVPINIKILATFRKDFYKQFLND
jgi:hypothetical protein